jgi:type VI secretion system ImpM family protein
MDAIVCYGKVPAYGDFVSVNAAIPVVRAFDDWIRRGLYLLSRSGRTSADAAFDAAATYGFAFSDPNSSTPLTGLMAPSRDLAGRRFPLIIALAPPAGLGRFELLPRQTASFLKHSRELIYQMQHGMLDVREVDFRGQAWGSWFQSASAAELRATTLGHLATGLWARFDDPRKERVFKNLRHILDPLHGRLPASFPLALRFPIRPQHASEDSSFWLTVLLRLLPGLAQPSFFWTHEPAVNHAAFLLVSLRRPGTDAFIHLIQPDEEGEDICNLESMQVNVGVDRTSGLPLYLENLLNEEQLTLDRFLERLI